MEAIWNTITGFFSETGFALFFQEGNWRWRLTADALTEALSDRIMSLVKEYGRI